jgi:Tfp pilus assembly protein PilV
MPNTKKIQVIVAVLTIIVLSTIAFFTRYFITQRQAPQSTEAWQTQQSVVASCQDNTVVLSVSFSNTEPNHPQWTMNVAATDLNTDQSINLGTINPGDNKTGVIDTGLSDVPSGEVVFSLTWANGRSGTDQRVVAYDSLECQTQIHQCTAISLYTTDDQPLNANQITIGQTIRVAIGAIFPDDTTKARFSFDDGATWTETTDKNNQEQYYLEWTVPDIDSLQIISQIYHPTFGWR